MIDANDVPPMGDPDPIPLTQAVQLPPFPVDAFPQAIADMVKGVAEATQTDPAMPGTSALSTLSACTGGHAEIEIRSGWREPLVLYTASIAGSGERKSAVQQAMVGPIFVVEEQLSAAGMTARIEAEARKQIAAKAAEKARNAAASATGDDASNAEAMENAIHAAKFAELIEVPPVSTFAVFGDLVNVRAGRL